MDGLRRRGGGAAAPSGHLPYLRRSVAALFDGPRHGRFRGPADVHRSQAAGQKVPEQLEDLGGGAREVAAGVPGGTRHVDTITQQRKRNVKQMA